MRILSSYKTSIILLLIYAVGLATATFVEKQMGAQAARMLVYYSPLFFFLQFLLVVNFILVTIQRHFIRKKRWSMVVVHFALLVILTGALITFLFGKEGQIHIREGEKTNQMLMHSSKGLKTEKFPFELELVDFRLVRYPGSQSPSSYESDLLVHLDGAVSEAKISMNKVLDIKGYRFFQASYDQDEKGTILSVNRDVAGRAITYSGYLLLGIGFLLMFIMPSSRFRKLQQELKETRGMLKKSSVILVMLMFVFFSHAQEMEDGTGYGTIWQYAIPSNHAARFGELPVQFRGRIMPMNTFSSEILRKVHKEQTFNGLNSDQFLLGLLAMPQLWMHAPLISLPDDGIYKQYNLPDGHAPYSLFFDKQGNYRLLSRLQEVYHQPADTRSTSEKELIKLDERVNILYQLFNHSLFSIFPDPNDSSHTWYPPGDELSALNEVDSIFVAQSFGRYLAEVRQAVTSGDWSKADEALEAIKAYQVRNDKVSLIQPARMKAELRYNRLNLFNRVKVGYFIIGGLLLLIAMIQSLNDKRWMNYLAFSLNICLVLLFFCHISGMGLRWYISGYAPWSNSYETMVYVSWATVLAGFIFGWKNILTRALSTLFGGVILFVASLNWMDPQIDTLVPVLKSPWLMFHVAVIVAAYGFFGMGFLLGITNLALMAFAKKSSSLVLRIRELSIINNMSLLAGLILMASGTFIGAVWANESWGRYWGWDPKETWALITVVVYSILTHLHLVKRWHTLWSYNLLSVYAFASVLMTFLGVNYLMSGMHSYGRTEAASTVFIYMGVAFAILGILGVLSYGKRKSFGVIDKK